MDIFNALAEPTRREILLLLARRGQLSASDIYRKFDLTKPAVSQHLKVLRDSKLVRVEKKAQRRLYDLNPEKISEFEKWAKQMTRIWHERFERLDRVLAVEKRKGVRKYGR